MHTTAASPLATTLADAFNQRDLSIWSSQCATDAEFSYPGYRGQRGVEGARAFNAIFLAAFSDLHFRVDHLTIDGDRSIACVTARGTHDGPLVTPVGTFAPTGRTGEVQGVFIATTRDGLIVKEETYWDRGELMAQLSGEGA
jgi:ketosteroid isomerase-like protein